MDSSMSVRRNVSCVSARTGFTCVEYSVRKFIKLQIIKTDKGQDEKSLFKMLEITVLFLLQVFTQLRALLLFSVMMLVFDGDDNWLW